MNDYEQIPDCGDYTDAEMADYANEMQLLEQDWDRQNALRHCYNLAQNDPSKSIRTAAAIMVAQLEKIEADYVRH